MISMEESVRPKSQVIDDMNVCLEDRVIDIGEEISVFEIAEDKEVNCYAGDHQCFATILGNRVVHVDAQPVSQQGGEDEQKDEKSRGFVIEDETEEKKISIAECLSGLQPFVFGDDECEEYINNEEEHPEVDLGEQQRLVAVE